MNQVFSKIWIVVILIVFIAGGILAWQYFGVLKEEVKVPEEKISEEELMDLTKFSIKDLPFLSSPYLFEEKIEPWEEIKGEEVESAFYQNFMRREKPLMVILDVRQYKTLERAEEEYNKLHELETELGTRTEKIKKISRLMNVMQSLVS